MIEIEYAGTELSISAAEKIYDVKNTLKNKINIHCDFRKGMYIMELGYEILLLKKGYVLDSVNINVKLKHSVLRYIGDNRIIHFNNKFLELYHFDLNNKAKPYKIKINPIDSVQINLPDDCAFFDVIPVYNDNLLLVLSMDPAANRKKRG